jgi:hypothetical protein
MMAVSSLHIAGENQDKKLTRSFETETSTGDSGRPSTITSSHVRAIIEEERVAV